MRDEPDPLIDCEREELHRSGFIQPHGALLVADGLLRVTHASANLAAYLDQSPESLLGRPLPDALGDLVAALPRTEGAQRRRAEAIDGRDGTLDCVVTNAARDREPAATIIELTRHRDWRPTAPLPTWSIAPRDLAELHGRRNELLRRIRGITGFQRVMFYEFREDGDGEVVDEVKDEALPGTYLDLRFPGSDIPQIARALYRINPWRLIADGMAPPVPILSQSKSPPDLSRSDLRSVSPVHCAYMANMRVRASISFPVSIGGELHALVTAHHGEAQTPPPLRALMHISDLVREFALGFASFRAQERFALTNELRWYLEPVARAVREAGGFAAAWDVIAPLLLSKLSVDGAMLVVGDRVRGTGAVLGPEALGRLEAWATQKAAYHIAWIESFRLTLRDFPPCPSSGAAILPAGLPGRASKGRLYLLRNEFPYDVAWGGNPDKPVESEDGSLRISPRHSFEKWVERRSGYCRPWDTRSRMLIQTLRPILQGG